MKTDIVLTMNRKSILLFCLLLLLNTAVSSQANVTVFTEPYAIPALPGLQSFAAAQYDGKWVIIGGRTDGLHQRQPNSSFLSINNNTKIFVVDPGTNDVWSALVTSLPVNLSDQLQSTNMLFCSDSSKLYIAGGYGYSVAASDHKTYASLVVVDLPGLIQAVITGNAINSYFRQLSDNYFALTGGQMAKLGDMFIMVGGQRFDGRYNPNNGPSFVQEYSNQVRKFKLADDGVSLSINYQQSITDAAQLHRRDYNMAPQVFPDRKLGYTAFSGVFQTAANLPFLNSVDIDTVGYTPNTLFNQLLNHYHCGKFSVYDSAANLMHSFFLGGMAQFYYDAGGNLEQDNAVPFVSTIGRVSRDASGAMTETRVGDLPGLLGSGAEFMLNHDMPLYANEVIRLNDINTDTVLAGYLVGGIQSTAPNIFFVNNGTQSSAANTIFKVYLVKQSGPVPVSLLSFRGNKVSSGILLEWKTAWEQDNSHFIPERSANATDYVPLASIKASGNGSTVSAYSYVDENPVNGFNYYRLRQVDKDGKSALSTVILVRFEAGKEPILVYPNPVREKLVLELTNDMQGQIVVKIIDLKGNILYSQFEKITSRQLNINVSALPAGVYFIETTINQKVQSNKFVKE